MSTMTQPARSLTHDEKKAAEAAFRGAPFNPKWSDAARKVYEGLALAMANHQAQKSSQMGMSQN